MSSRVLRRSAWIASMSALVVACGFPASAPPPPAASPAALEAARLVWPDTSAATLAEGRELFVSKCDGCHGHPDVVAIPLTRWPAILADMGPKASLDARQTESVLRFVTAARAQRTGETPKAKAPSATTPATTAD